MDNFKLLEKRRKRLSVYFALFVLFSTWLIELLFFAWVYFVNNIHLENEMKTKYIWVENIIKNFWEYSQKIKENDEVVKMIIEKWLNNTTISKNNEIIYWNIDFSKFENKSWFINSKFNKYYIKNIVLNWNYKIIISANNNYSIYKFITYSLYFLIFTIPFFIMFYWLWYYFVWKNFRPIREIIESLEDFSWNINHELKTPLSEIISTLSLYQEIKINPEKTISTTLNSALKMSKILDSMLWIINLVDSSYKLQKLDLIDELNKIIEENKTFLNEKHLKIIKNYSSKAIYKKINREHFEICVWNILKNSIKYSYEKTNIEIFFDGKILKITDYWIWIDKSNLKNIFSRYFRENYINYEWFGLWLSLVKKICDINKWKISIESEKNVKTIVSINFN